MTERTKSALRSRLLAARAARPSEDRTATATALARALAAFCSPTSWPKLAAGYLSLGTEPGTGPLLETLAGAGAEVIVPVLKADGDLDWAPYAPGSSVAPGLRGTTEPTGARLGVEAVEAAGLVLVPALAVDRQGHRLGRGGGSFDRALARRLRAGASGLVLAVIHDDEVVDELPVESHDCLVDGVLTPTGVALYRRATKS
jgi:5-formyltetrahydrofolate cyclo-ligase